MKKRTVKQDQVTKKSIPGSPKNQIIGSSRKRVALNVLRK